MVTHKHEERLRPRVHEIIIPATRGGTRRAGVAESFVYEPTTIEEEPLGHLFVLGEIMGEMPAAGPAAGAKKQSAGGTRAAVPRRRQDWGHLLNVIASLIKREYYAHANRSAHAALEAALRKANAAISELSPANTSWANSFHGAAVALSRNNLHFSAIGNMALYLKRGKRLTDVAATIPRTARRNTRPAFRTIASGKLAPDDIMLVTSARTASTLSDSANNANPFMTLPPFAEITSKLTALLRTAGVGPAAVLAVSVELETPPKSTVLENPAAPLASKPAAFEPTETDPEITQPAESRFDLLRLKAAALLRKTTALPAQTIEPARRWWRAGAAILIVTVLAVWGAQHVPSLFQQSAARSANRASLREARNKHDAAEKALLSGKNTQAKQLLAQALGILGAALADPSTRSDAEALAADVRTLELKAERAELVTEPEAVFRTDALAVKFAASGAVAAGGALVFYSEESNVLVRVQPDQGAAETIFANLEPQEGIRAGTAVEDEAVFLTTRDRLIKLMGANRGTQFLGLAPPHAVDIKSFGSNLYFLANASPYILKAPVRGGTLQPARPWLKNESDAPTVSNSSRMAIDGAIWILEDASRAELIRFREGRRTGTIGLGVDAASAVESFATDSDHETIAAVSTNPARLIALSKTGETLSRIASPVLEQARALLLLENAAVVVTPTEAFRFELPPRG
ncbi:hypothetical protein HY442_00045 [Candidatus Parcubacteria bacterium]|nr:hypothetical protein [Candidatus Parcubacteria bacterium]MBI4385614.1 hypothetical protein [Candidatus Parcubacteria bacterium]